ncbi:MAG: phospholipase D-like domain-containing protein [Betaproteobacteria bacterium]
MAATAIASLLATLVVLNLSLGNKPIDTPPARVFSVADPQFQRFMGSVLTPDVVPGNRAQELLNGDQIFPAMLGAIRAAQETITLETYIYWSGAIGREFSAALRERAGHGIRIHILLDWVGSDLDDPILAEMRESGIEVRRYNKPAWFSLGRINHRTHRRLLVVDGGIGFIGGAGIGDKWRGHAQGPEHWRDTHFQVWGPVVTQMQSAFIDNWIRATGQVLHREGYLPKISPQGFLPAHIFTSSPGGGAKSMQLMYLMSITSAATSIDLSAAYFVPDEVALEALEAALKRGVRLRIIVPGPHMDKEIVRRASRATWGRLLAGGRADL